MLQNIKHRDTLTGLYRAKRRNVDAKSIPKAHVQHEVEAGWQVEKRNKNSVRITRRKPHWVLWEDRVWVLLYKFGFSLLSGQGGAKLLLDPQVAGGASNQIDVVGIDDEIAIAIECKSAESWGRRVQFSQEVAKHGGIREKFINMVNVQYGTTHKRQAFKRR